MGVDQQVNQHGVQAFSLKFRVSDLGCLET